MDKPLSLHKEQRKNVISGKQTQHREPIKNRCVLSQLDNKSGQFSFDDIFIFCPYQVGDKLWLQEPYQIGESDVHTKCVWGHYRDDKETFNDKRLTLHEFDLWRYRKFPCRRTSGRFMYKSLARHWFEVTGVKAERVQDISEEDCLKEGIKYKLNCGIGGETCYDDVVGNRKGEYRWLNPKPPFQRLWDSYYGEGAWDRNDWVWCYTFRKIDYGK